jgi:hypothetical protein
MYEEHSIIHAGPIPEFWALLTEEQKRKVAVMKMDLKIQWLETKINDMEKLIELKKKAIADIRKVQEMMK